MWQNWRICRNNVSGISDKFNNPPEWYCNSQLPATTYSVKNGIHLPVKRALQAVSASHGGHWRWKAEQEVFLSHVLQVLLSPPDVWLETIHMGKVCLLLGGKAQSIDQFSWVPGILAITRPLRGPGWIEDWHVSFVGKKLWSSTTLQSVSCQGLEVQGFWNPAIENHRFLCFWMSTFEVAKHVKQIINQTLQHLRRPNCPRFPKSSVFKCYILV